MHFRNSGDDLVATPQLARIASWKTGKMELASHNETLETMKHIDPNGEIIPAARAALATFGDSA
ncbi:MAG: hypothetical protein WAM58_01405 [Candidatus Acidiferrum sp.]